MKNKLPHIAAATTYFSTKAIVLGFCFLLLATTSLLAQEGTNAGGGEASDTVVVSNTGKNNQILIDSIELSTKYTDTLSLPFTGRIFQSGTANRTEINTNRNLNNTNGKLNKVVIKQTGTNNKVKINSQ